MFSSRPSPYDELVAKATDEKQSEIDWATAATVWDKVNDDGETGARNCVTALQKRLNHRSANVQILALTLASALVNNCGAQLHREISGKVFTQALVRLIGDRNTHPSTRSRALSFIEETVKEHPSQSDFDLLLDTYESLKRSGHIFPSSSSSTSSSSAPARAKTPERGGAVDDETLRREEEELQRVLALSAAEADPMKGFRKSSPSTQHRHSDSLRKDLPSEPSTSKPSRVRALFDFEGQTAEELPLRKGEEVRVLEEVSKDWWRGESLGSGRQGIFPTNYIEILPDLPPAPTHIPQSHQSHSSHSQPPPAAATEDEIEGEIFAQAASIDRLLSLMHTLRGRGEDFAESEELTELYNSSMRLRPKVVQLIRKYEQKQADLQGLSDKVAHAKATYEQMAGLPPSHPYGQPQPHQQPNGYGQHPQPHYQQHPQQHPTPSPAPPHHQQPPHSAAPLPQQQQQVDPIQAQREHEEEQKREYERKYAEYLRELEVYNQQIAAQQQQHQQHLPPAVGHADLHHAQQAPSHNAPPPSSVDPSTLARSDSASTPAPQLQPIWDGQQWVWPTQAAHTAHPPSSSAGAIPLASPQLAAAQQPPPPGQGYPQQTQPYPQPGSDAGSGLEGGMAALSVSPPPPLSSHQHHQPQREQHYHQAVPQQQLATAGYALQGQPGQQQQQPHQPDAAEIEAQWAAWHAQQAQQTQGQVQQ